LPEGLYGGLFERLVKGLDAAREVFAGMSESKVEGFD